MKRWIKEDRQWAASIGLLGLFSGLLTIWELKDVARSEYYASIARSMSVNLGNFFFGAIDPAGTVTLDKIPGSYWVPAIFVRIFGFSTWSITVPNALATVGLVIVVALTGKMVLGKRAGLIAGAVVATTPIVIAVARSNQPQSFFLLTLAIAGYFAAKALMLESRRYLIISGAWIAVAFHTYMLVAWALWPALIVAWLFTAQPRLKKIIDLLIAGMASLALSMSWILAVALVPAAHRPYIGGTYHNNPFEMVFGYNGLGRFKATTNALSSVSDDPTFRSFTPPFGGEAGIGRIFSAAVAGQIAWVIPVAVVAVIALILLRFSKTLVIFYALWLGTFFAMFSAVAGIHQFYTSALAIPVALLVSLAVTKALDAQKPWLNIALLNTAGLSSLFIAQKYGDYVEWATYIQIAIILITAAFIFNQSERVLKFALPTLITAGLIATPAVWAADAHNYTNSINPIAGKAGIEGFGGMRGGFDRSGRPDFPGGGQPPQGNFPPRTGFNGQAPGGMNFGEVDNSEIIEYLKANRSGAKFFLTTFGAQSAASYITATGENVLPIGGFDGQDPTPTLEAFKKLVNAGEVRYVLAGGGGGRGQSQGDNEIALWVSANCSVDTNAPSGNLYLCLPSK